MKPPVTTYVSRIETRKIVRPLLIPFSTALGSKAFLENVLVTVTLDDGTPGTGEVPTSFSNPHETIVSIRGAVKEASGSLIGSPIDAWKGKIEKLRCRLPWARMTLSGLEVALFRAYLAASGVGEFQYWGGSSGSLTTDITVPFSTDAGALLGWLKKASELGFRIFKLKVSGDMIRDPAFVTLVRSVLDDLPGPCTLRFDGNQGFTKESFLEFHDFLEKWAIEAELFEQPLPKEDLEGSAYVRQRAAFPIVLDEGVYSVDTMRRAIDSGACDGINIKTAKSGILETRAMVEIARKEGVRLMVGCMMETMTGLSAALYLASGTGVFDFIDLDSVYFLRSGRGSRGIAVEGPRFTVRS